MYRLVLILAVACSGSKGAREPATDERGCLQDEVARAKCEGRGPSYQYAHAPRNCGGARIETPPPPGPCECIESEELEKLHQECAEAP